MVARTSVNEQVVGCSPRGSSCRGSPTDVSSRVDICKYSSLGQLVFETIGNSFKGLLEMYKYLVLFRIDSLKLENRVILKDKQNTLSGDHWQIGGSPHGLCRSRALTNSVNTAKDITLVKDMFSVQRF